MEAHYGSSVGRKQQTPAERSAAPVWDEHAAEWGVDRLDAAGAPADAGTIIVATEYDGGVVVACDTRVTVGNFVHNRSSEKIATLTDWVYLGRSGSCPDAQALSDYVCYMADQHAAALGRELETETVATLVSDIIYNNKGMNGGQGLSATLVLGGWDKYEGGTVWALTLGGSMVRVPWAIDGSGSTGLWSYFDDGWRPGMTRGEAEAFVLNAIALVNAHDASCGGNCRMVTVDKDGAKRQYFPHERMPVIRGDLPEPGKTHITFSGGLITGNKGIVTS